MTTQELLGALFVPVLLGSERVTWRISRRLFWQYGMISHVFAERFSLLCRLTPWIVRHPLPRGTSSALLELALTDFAAEISDTDRTPLLFLTQDKHTPRLTPPQLDTLERSFMLCREGDESMPFPLTEHAQGEQSL